MRCGVASPLAPEARPPLGRGRGHSLGVTRSDVMRSAACQLRQATPKASELRTSRGPIRKWPRCWVVMSYPAACRQRPRPRTRVKVASRPRSSGSRSRKPSAEKETVLLLVISRRTRATSPTGRESGMTERLQVRRGGRTNTITSPRTGKETMNTPTHARSGSPMMAATAAMMPPNTSIARPRPVSPKRNPCMSAPVWWLSGGDYACDDGLV